jgi:hypothetical protein
MTSHSKRKEESLQIAVSTYLKLNYPDVVFTSESSGIRVSIGTAMKMKKQRCEGKLPDMIVLEPRGQYNGLVMELKTVGQSPFLRNGSLSENAHVREQARMLDRLKHKGYYALFVVGIDQAIRTIEDYLKMPIVTK